MIKGCKHYFSMFGIMFMTANRTLQQLFNKIISQIKKSINIKIDYNYIHFSKKSNIPRITS